VQSPAPSRTCNSISECAWSAAAYPWVTHNRGTPQHHASAALYTGRRFRAGPMKGFRFHGNWRRVRLAQPLVHPVRPRPGFVVIGARPDFSTATHPRTQSQPRRLEFLPTTRTVLEHWRVGHRTSSSCAAAQGWSGSAAKTTPSGSKAQPSCWRLHAVGYAKSSIP
jgi:hypothetical protein